jgi:hypothetical protein
LDASPFPVQLNNPDFKPVEFDGFRKQAGLNSFTLTPKQWIEATGAKGNIRDEANGAQLVCLSNMESVNAEFIKQKIPQGERLRKLNAIAIEQMKVLVHDAGIKRLPPGG